MDWSGPTFGKSVEDYVNSEFFKRKAKTYFSTMDVVEDGFLTRSDYEAISKGYIALQFDESKTESIRKVFDELFNDIVAFKSEGEDPKVSFEEFFENSAHAFQNRDLATSRLTAAANAIFDFMDLNGDGVISPEEYKKFHKVHFGKKYDNTEETAMIAFRSMDTNHDGIISREEFVSAHLHFCYECFGDESTSVLPFGPLADL